MLVKCRPLDHVRFERIIDLRNKLESQGLRYLLVNSSAQILSIHKHTLRTVEGGMQCVKRS